MSDERLVLETPRYNVHLIDHIERAYREMADWEPDRGVSDIFVIDASMRYSTLAGLPTSVTYNGQNYYVHAMGPNQRVDYRWLIGCPARGVRKVMGSRKLLAAIPPGMNNILLTRFDVRRDSGPVLLQAIIDNNLEEHFSIEEARPSNKSVMERIREEPEFLESKLANYRAYYSDSVPFERFRGCVKEILSLEAGLSIEIINVSFPHFAFVIKNPILVSETPIDSINPRSLGDLCCVFTLANSHGSDTGVSLLPTLFTRYLHVHPHRNSGSGICISVHADRGLFGLLRDGHLLQAVVVMLEFVTKYNARSPLVSWHSVVRLRHRARVLA
jgi:hypothetical protein